MRIILPYSRHDTDQFKQLVQVMLKFGGLNRQIITILTVPSQEDMANEQAEKLRDKAHTVDVLLMNRELDGNRWPQNPNAMFSHAAAYIQTQNDKMPWLWLEPDCVPLKEGWIDRIEVDYEKSGKPYMGYTMNVTNELGDVPDKNGFFMLGCAVYPHDCRWHMESEYMYNDLRVDGTEVPWDIYMRWVFRKRGWQHSEAIGNFWKSKNFRMENGSLVCDLIDPPTRATSQRKTMVHPDCVVVHGCKDDSLVKMVLEKSITEWRVETEPENKAPITSGNGVALSTNLELRLQAIEKRLDALELPSITVTTSSGIEQSEMIGDLVVYDDLGSSDVVQVEQADEGPIGEHGVVQGFYDEATKWVNEKSRRASEFKAKFPDIDLSGFLNACNYEVVKPGWIKKRK